MTSPVVVSGGSGGITANADDILAVGVRFGQAAVEIGCARRDVTALTARSFSIAGALDPFHGGTVTEMIALADVHDLVGQAAQELWIAGVLCNDIGRGMVGAATRYDELEHRLSDSGPFGFLGHLVHGSIFGQLDLLAGHSPWHAAQVALTSDPAMTTTLADGSGLAGGLILIGAVNPDGRGVVRGGGIDATGVAGAAPRALSDIVSDLAHRDNDKHDGEIDVRILTMADGSRKAIVDITGTKTWHPYSSSDVADLTTNVHALTGARTAYEQGVLAAMRRAGVRKGDDVMLVGHSQGGMIAVNAARHASASGQFHVTHVVTAGAPVGVLARRLPTGTRLLALENRRDVVPALDHTVNPDRRNVTTATVDLGDGTVLGDHGLDTTYVPAARLVQASPAASVRDFLSSAGGYFRATHVTTHTFQIQRR